MKIIQRPLSVVLTCLVLMIVISLVGIQVKPSLCLSTDSTCIHTRRIDGSVDPTDSRLDRTESISVCLKDVSTFWKRIHNQGVEITNRKSPKHIMRKWDVNVVSILKCLFIVHVIMSQFKFLDRKNITNHRKLYSESRICSAKEKNTYDFVFHIPYMYTTITVGMLPCNHQRYNKPNTKHNHGDKESTNQQSVSEQGAAAAGCDVSDRKDVSQEDSICSDGTTLRKVSHPEFEERSARYVSFRDWPRVNRPDPELLSDAGFYYIGSGDTVRCFCCGGGLGRLTSNSNPHEDHLRQFPFCEYILRHPNINGQLVASGVTNGNNHDGQTFTSGATNGNMHGGLSITSGASNDEKEQKKRSNDKIKAPTSTADRKTQLTYSEIKSLLEMGFKRQQIEDLITRQLSNGEHDVTTDSVIDTLVSNEPPNATVKSEDTGTNIPPHVTANREEVDSNLSSITKSQQSADSHPVQQCQERESAVKPQTNGLIRSGETDITSDECLTPGNSVTKNETVNKVKQENRQLKEQMLCKICLDRPSSIVFLDCGHMVSCTICAPSMRKCPICRKVVKGRVQVL